MRDYRVDFLRFCGLCLVVLAHCSPPDILFQIRNFDVPMMVLLAGISYALSFKQQSYIDYVFSRTKRLLFPVWCFLSVYFISCLLISFPTSFPPMSKILSSYMLNEGIGYVWIIRVFLMVALAAPIIFYIHRRVSNNLHYLLLILFVLIINEVILNIVDSSFSSLFGKLLEKTVFYVVPYGAVFALGLRFLDLSKMELIATGFFVAGLFGFYSLGLWFVHGEFVATQEYKYPPQIYYFSYAIFMSILLWGMANPLLKWVNSLKLTGLVLFMGQNSIWIYLWHIVFVTVIDAPFLSMFTAVLVASVVVTYVQISFLQKVLLPRIESQRVRKNVTSLFTG